MKTNKDIPTKILSCKSDHSVARCNKIKPSLPQFGRLFYSLNTHVLEEVGFKPMAFYIKLKSYYCNGTIYNYSLRKVAKLAGCSTTLAKKNIELLQSHNLITFHNGNLTLNKLNKHNLKRGNVKVMLDTNLTIQEYKDKLLVILMQRKINQQTRAAVKSIRIDRVKRKTCSINTLLGEISDKDLAIGMDCFSKYLKVSKSGLSLLIKRLESKKKLIRKDIQENLGKLPKIDNEYFDEGFTFVNKFGNTIIHYGSTYRFP